MNIASMKARVKRFSSSYSPVYMVALTPCAPIRCGLEKDEVFPTNFHLTFRVNSVSNVSVLTTWLSIEAALLVSTVTS